jgi:hypothetical protein
MLSYAVAIGKKQNAQNELRDQLEDRKTATAKYRRLSLLLLVPLLVLIPALSQMRPRPPRSL